MKKYPLWRFCIDTGPASLFGWDYHACLKEDRWHRSFGFSNNAKRCLGYLPLELRSRVEKFVESSEGWRLVVVKLRADNACPWFFVWELRTSTSWCHLHVGFEIHKVVWGREEETRRRDLPKNIIIGGGVYDVVDSLASRKDFGCTLNGWNLGKRCFMHIVTHPIRLAEQR